MSKRILDADADTPQQEHGKQSKKEEAKEEEGIKLADISAFMRVRVAIDVSSDLFIPSFKHPLNDLLCVRPKSESFVFHETLAKDYGWRNVEIMIDSKYQCGTLDRPDVEKLMNLAKPAVFGKGDKEVYDTNVRLAHVIEGKRLSFLRRDSANRHFTYDQPFAHLLGWGNRFKKWCGVEPKHVELYALHLYPQGGKFDTHVDTPHAPNHVASAIYITGSPFEGGVLEVEHMGEKDCTSSPHTVAAWYVDCPHRVLEVTRGTRIVLQFNVFSEAMEKQNDDKEDDDEQNEDDEDDDEEDDGDDNDIDFADNNIGDEKDFYLANDMWKTRFITTLKASLENKHHVALLLEHTYSTLDHVLQPENLKGRDRLLWDTLIAEKENIVCGLVAVARTTAIKQEQKNTDYVTRLSSLPPGIESVPFIDFIPGPQCQWFEVFYNPGAEHTGNEPMDGSAAYVAFVLYCAPDARKEE